MTGFARTARIQVSRVFSGGDRAVVATKTRLSNHRIVVESNRPVHGGMARIARLRGSNMGGMLPCGNDTVVTTFTASHHMVVINVPHAAPFAYHMAGIA